MAETMYARWDEVERRVYEEVLDFLAESDWYGPETIAHGITGRIMSSLDGYEFPDDGV